jgi:hypothetical protein
MASEAAPELGAIASRDAVPWLHAAFAAPPSYAPVGAVEYVRVGRDVVPWPALLSDGPVGVGVAAGVREVGAGPLHRASGSESLRRVPGVGVTTVPAGTAFAG